MYNLMAITNQLAMADDESPQVVTEAIINCNLHSGMSYLFNL